MIPALTLARALLDQPPADPIPGQLDLTRSAVTQQPVRIQRRRTKGWRKPDNTVIVTRPSRFGNPFTLGMVHELGYAQPGEIVATRRAAVGAFRDWLRGNRLMWQSEEGDTARQRLLDGLPELRGKNLACYCPLPADGQPDYCHAAVLLELANAPATP